MLLSAFKLLLAVGLLDSFLVQAGPLTPVEIERGFERTFDRDASASFAGQARGQESLLDAVNPYRAIGAAELVFPGGRARNIIPKNIHSHNDYWRDVPLYSALANGVRSIEADVWLNPKDQRLYVGHNYLSLTRARSFSHLYVDQLVKVLSDRNVRDDEYRFFNETNYVSSDNVVETRRPWEPFFDESPSSIQLVVDLKTKGDVTYQALMRELEPLRERGWLTRWDGEQLVQGPVSVVMTGNGYNRDVRAIVPTLDVVDAFMDAPLLLLNETWTGIDGKTYAWNATSNAPLASASYSSVTDYTGREPISQAEAASLRKVFADAQALGFKTRAYSPPRWPIFVRNRVRAALYEARTDFMDADEIEDMAAF